MAYILNKVSILCRPVFYKNIISGSIIKNTLVKSYEHFTKTNALAEQKFKLKDNISNNYRLVYREHSAFNLLITLTYHAGLIGCVTSLSLSIGYLIYTRPSVFEKETDSTKELLIPLSPLQIIFFLFTSFALSIVLIVGSKIIPLRIYHSSAEKVYKAVFVNRILGKQQIETFGEGTVVPVFSRKHRENVLFKINDRIVLLDRECFPVQIIRERMICKTK